jgi:ABC-type multidrug transport system, permease component
MLNFINNATCYRIITLIKKELALLWQDKQTRIILIMPVLLQIIIFPFAATLDVTNATIAVYRPNIDEPSTELINRLSHANSFSKVLVLDSQAAICDTINHQKALVVVQFPDDFARKLLNDESPQLQIILDGRKSNSAQIAANYIQQIIMQYQQQRSGQTHNGLIVRHRFNSNLDYKYFILPSLVALITTIGVMIVTSLSVAREREQGTLDQLRISPLATWQIFIGKAIPAIIVATLQGSAILIASVFIYQIPFQGNWLLFYLCMMSYGLSLVGFGLFISSLCSTQQQAFIGIITFMVPAILLSGFIAPIENMPLCLRYLTELNPVRHFIELSKQIYLKDVSFSVIWSSLVKLYAITILMGGLSYYLFKKYV